MADFAPPYDIAVHPKFRDSDFDDLPKWLQNRIERYSVKSEDVEDADEPEEEPVTGEPRPTEDPTEDDDDLDENGDPMPVDAEFPFHKGGGYYVLSNGKIVRGLEEAEEAEANL